MSNQAETKTAGRIDPEEEREAALAQDAMTQGEYHSAALNQYAGSYGAEHPDRAWIGTPFDTWEPNPFYVGPPVRHPEDDQQEEEEPFESHYAERDIDRGPF